MTLGLAGRCPAGRLGGVATSSIVNTTANAMMGPHMVCFGLGEGVKIYTETVQSGPEDEALLTQRFWGE